MYEVLLKHGDSVCRCGLEEERTRRTIETPTWMFEPAAWCRLHVTAVPTVGCDALRELQALLRTVARPDPGGVLHGQHRSLLAAGGADAPVSELTATVAILVRPGNGRGSGSFPRPGSIATRRSANVASIIYMSSSSSAR